MKQFATAYAQQLYLLAEEGIRQAKKDNANYWYVDGSFPEEYPELWTEKRIIGLNHLIDELLGSRIKNVIERPDYQLLINKLSALVLLIVAIFLMVRM